MGKMSARFHTLIVQLYILGSVRKYFQMTNQLRWFCFVGQTRSRDQAVDVLRMIRNALSVTNQELIARNTNKHLILYSSNPSSVNSIPEQAKHFMLSLHQPQSDYR